MKRICVYHSVDHDGFFSLITVLRRYPDTEVYGYTYGDSIPVLSGYDEVIIVDVTLPIEKMIDLDRKTHLVWIDHHSGSNAKAKEAGFNPDGLRCDDSKAACELVWEFYFPREPIPRIVHLIGLYDTWMWKEDEDSLPVEYALRAIYLDYQDVDMWTNLLEMSDFSKFTEIGQWILAYQTKKDYKASYNILNIQFDGYKGIAINHSDAGLLFEQIGRSTHDIMISFMRVHGGWSFGIYSDGRVDVSMIASKWGGGGHAGAAGFFCKEIPFAIVDDDDNLLGKYREFEIKDILGEECSIVGIEPGFAIVCRDSLYYKVEYNICESDNSMVVKTPHLLKEETISDSMLDFTNPFVYRGIWGKAYDQASGAWRRHARGSLKTIMLNRPATWVSGNNNELIGYINNSISILDVMYKGCTDNMSLISSSRDFLDNYTGFAADQFISVAGDFARYIGSIKQFLVSSLQAKDIDSMARSYNNLIGMWEPLSITYEVITRAAQLCKGNNQ